MSKRDPADAGEKLSAEALADEIIADCQGDARAAVIELVTLIGALKRENAALVSSSSPGYARRSPKR